MSVTLVNLFEVPVGRDETFRAMWLEVNDYMRRQPGYVDHVLHRSLAADARYRYANIATWESADALRAAHASEGFRSRVGRPEWGQFPSRPGVYETVHKGGSGSAGAIRSAAEQGAVGVEGGLAAEVGVEHR